MPTTDILHKLTKFKRIDKYESFREILPAVQNTADDQKAIVTDILDSCCSVLIDLFQAPKRPAKIMLKKELIYCMDRLAIARVDTGNREFGYQLGWYLAEKVEVDLRKGTEKKVWGYWSVEANEVRPPVRPRSSVKKKQKAARTDDTGIDNA